MKTFFGSMYEISSYMKTFFGSMYEISSYMKTFFGSMYEISSYYDRDFLIHEIFISWRFHDPYFLVWKRVSPMDVINVFINISAQRTKILLFGRNMIFEMRKKSGHLHG